MWCQLGDVSTFPASTRPSSRRTTPHSAHRARRVFATCSRGPRTRMSAHAALGAFAAPRATRPTRGLDETVTRSPSSRARSRVRATPRAFLGGLGGAQRTKRTSKALTSDEVVPGQGRGSPKWNEIHAALVSAKVGKVAATDFERFCAKDDVLAIDVRQALEFEEWHVPPCVSCPYAVPDPNVLRRATGYAVSIKGGLKVRNPRFVDDARAAKTAAGAKTVVVVDTKGGDLDVSPKSPSAGSSGVYDTSDSQALRAAFELTQAGDFPDVRYVKGGLPAIVDDANVAFESEKWGSFLRGLDDANKSDLRRLLMYSRLLPDPTNLPGVLGQGFVFLFIGLAYYDVAGIGSWAAQNVPAACAILPVCL